MAKSEVYSWRLSPDTKAALEAAARAERSTVGGVLHDVVSAWLRGRRLDRRDDEQARLHAAAAKTFGTIRGGDPRRAERVRELVRRRVKQRRAG
jgi:hypothetical protein